MIHFANPETWSIGSDFHSILKVVPDGWTDNLCQISDQYLPGLWSSSWIKNEN